MGPRLFSRGNLWCVPFKNLQAPASMGLRTGAEERSESFRPTNQVLAGESLQELQRVAFGIGAEFGAHVLKERLPDFWIGKYIVNRTRVTVGELIETTDQLIGALHWFFTTDDVKFTVTGRF
jgi:hypothetical protein